MSEENRAFLVDRAETSSGFIPYHALISLASVNGREKIAEIYCTLAEELMEYYYNFATRKNLSMAGSMKCRLLSEGSELLVAAPMVGGDVVTICIDLDKYCAQFA